MFPPPLVSNTLCHEIRREEIPQETHPASGTAVEIASLARMTVAPDATLNVTMAETGATHPILGGMAKIELEVRGGMGIGMGMGGTAMETETETRTEVTVAGTLDAVETMTADAIENAPETATIAVQDHPAAQLPRGYAPLGRTRVRDPGRRRKQQRTRRNQTSGTQGCSPRRRRRCNMETVRRPS